MDRFGDAVISVIVGEHWNAPQTFTIHESVITRFSDFFAAAVKNGWKESEDRVVRLPDRLASDFEVFQSFIYIGRIFNNDPTELPNADMNEYTALALLWGLGEELQSTAFKDAVVDAFIEVLRNHEYMFNFAYGIIYSKSAGASPMRRLQVDTALWKWDAETVKNALSSETYSDFFQDLAAEQQKFIVHGRPARAPYLRSASCVYHEHCGSGSPCYKTMF